MNHHDWKTLIQLAWDGHRELLEKRLRWVYQRRLVPSMRPKCESLEQCQEACNLAVAKFWERFFVNQIPLPENVEGYLYQMAVNALYYIARMEERYRSKTHLSSGSLEDILMESPSFDDLDGRARHPMALAFAKLGERCRKLLWGHIVHKTPLKDIAEDMDFPSSNAAAQKKAACLKTLRREYYGQIKKADF